MGEGRSIFRCKAPLNRDVLVTAESAPTHRPFRNGRKNSPETSSRAGEDRHLTADERVFAVAAPRQAITG